MEILLQIASCVEAAANTYHAVQPVSDSKLEKWKAGFRSEMIQTAHHYQHMKNKNEGPVPVLHPTLAVLLIVSARHANLAKICRNFPDVGKHENYNPRTKFPEDISDLLPPLEDHWWEALAAKSRQRQDVMPNKPNKSADVVIEEVAEDIDKLEDNDYILPSESTVPPSSRSASTLGVETKKQKGASLLEPKAAKQCTGPLWRSMGVQSHLFPAWTLLATILSAIGV
ncbi:hypothetical protein V8E53_013507 [Lactarius tabidus]